MLGVDSGRGAARAAVALLVGLLCSTPAQAVTQPPPDSTPLPLPVPEDEYYVVTVRNFLPSAVELSGLFAFRGESLDPAGDAFAGPGTFRPLCDEPLSAEFVLHGGGCTLELAWYNATGVEPAPNELYTLVPATVTTTMGCTVPDFCPLASTGTTLFNWTPHTFTAVNFCDDVRWQGGAIGFALVGAASTPCSATKYSELAVNTECTSCTPAQPWVTTLMYRSGLRNDAYYIAFEDLPFDPADWRLPAPVYAPDGDFNDLVFHLSGLCHEGDTCTSSGGTGSGGTGTGGAGGTATGGASNGGSSAGGGQNGGDTSSGGTGEGGGGGSGNPGGEAGEGSGGTGAGGSGGSGSECVPGQTIACACPAGGEGVQQCASDGRSYGTCKCLAGEDDDASDSGGCGCRVAQNRSGWALLWTAGALVALVRWRRRTGSRASARTRPDPAPNR